MITISSSAFETVMSEASRSKDGLETGGILLGHDNGKHSVVTLAGDPGPRAERHPDRFLRDLHHAQALADDVYERDGSIWVGEWHTHPRGPHGPSPRDMATYLALLADEALGFHQLISVIVTPCPAHGWAELHVHAWLVNPAGARSTALFVEDASHG